MLRTSTVILLLAACGICAAGVPAGPVRLESATGASRGQCLQVPVTFDARQNHVLQAGCRNHDLQTFEIVPAPGGGHLIVNLHTGGCLDVEYASAKVDARILDWPCHGGLNQTWDLATTDDGANGNGGAFAMIQNRMSKFCLSMQSGLVFQGAPCNPSHLTGFSWYVRPVP
jgi:hypothetical protein